MDVTGNTTEGRGVLANRRAHRRVRYNTCHSLNFHNLTHSWYRYLPKASEEVMVRTSLREKAISKRITIQRLLLRKGEVTGFSEKYASD
jgi:hypothetical protein